MKKIFFLFFFLFFYNNSFAEEKIVYLDVNFILTESDSGKYINNELKKISKLNRNFKQKIMIHHNDILNFWYEYRLCVQTSSSLHFHAATRRGHGGRTAIAAGVHYAIAAEAVAPAALPAYVNAQSVLAGAAAAQVSASAAGDLRSCW